MENEFKDKTLSELIEVMIFTTIDYNDKVKLAEFSPCSSKKEMELFYLKEYKKKSEPLKAELDRREKLYSQKA